MILFVFLFNINIIYGVTCYNAIGSSISGDNQVSTANCNAYPGTTLVGCHFNATHPSAANIESTMLGHDGTYFQESTCYARSGPTGSVTARARCCDLSSWGISNNNCESRESDWSSPDEDDVPVSINCQSNYMLFGCAGYSDGDIDGRCTSNTDECNVNNNGNNVDRCVAVDGRKDDGAVRAYGRCCQSSQYPKSDFICKSIWGIKGSNQVECPQGYDMFNCNNVGAFGRFTIKGAYITTTSNTDTCFIDAPDNDDYAIATCCQFIPPTSAPTKTPSKSPTNIPTKIPSLSPTVTPTDVPTVNPTSTPTQSPTVTPTLTPSKSPTNTPTTSPSNIPTTFPTDSPTESPSTQPTLSPTQNPSHTPSISPSKVPTTIPSITPTQTPTKASNSPTFKDAATDNNGSSVQVILKQYGTVIIALFIGIILLLIICMLLICCMKKKDKDEHNIAIELQSVPANMKSFSNSQMKSFSKQMEVNTDPNTHTQVNLNVNTDHEIRNPAPTVYSDIEGENVLRPHKITQSGNDELYNKGTGPSTNNGWHTTTGDDDDDVWNDDTTRGGPTIPEEIIIVHNNTDDITYKSDV